MDLSVRSSTFGKNNSDTNLMKFLKTCDVPLELVSGIFLLFVFLSYGKGITRMPEKESPTFPRDSVHRSEHGKYTGRTGNTALHHIAHPTLVMVQSLTGLIT